MNLNILESSILNTILIMFPILIYLVYNFCFDIKMNEKRNNSIIVLNICLFTSLYLCLRFGMKSVDSKLLLFCNIPIIISYIKKQTVTGILLSTLNIVYCLIFNISITYIIIKYISYFLLYIIGRKRNLSNDSFILSVAVIQGFFLSFEYFFVVNQISMNDLLILLVIVFIYYFITFLILYLFRVIDKIQNINNTILKLEKDKKMKDALFKLTHEIKNPLAVCKGYIEMIDLNKQDKSKKYLNIIDEEINRSLNIISDFSEINKIKIQKELFDINYLLDDVYESFKMLAKSKHIKLIYDDNNIKETYIKIDYERIKQVIVNMLKNSLEAIKEKGYIKLSSNINKKYVDIIIEDNGIGMDEDTLKHLKEMFYTTKKNGTGLGVALSNEIVISHGGELIYSSNVGKGTKAIIRLPF